MQNCAGLKIPSCTITLNFQPHFIVNLFFFLHLGTVSVLLETK